MVVKKFKEYISEGMWKSGLDRARNNELRREQGKKVHTILGSDLILSPASDIDYDKIITMLLNACSSPHQRREYHAKIQPKSILNTFSKNVEGRYFPVKQPDGREEIIMLFPEYDSAISSWHLKDTGLEEEDYYAIIQHIGEHLKDKPMIHGNISDPNLFYIGTYDKRFANEMLFALMNDKHYDADKIDFLTLTATGTLDKFDLGFNITFTSTMLYDDIMEAANRFLKINGMLEEGMWKSGLDRAKKNVARIEDRDSVYYLDNVFPVEGYDGYYFQYRNSADDFFSKEVRIYIKPHEQTLCNFYDIAGHNVPIIRSSDSMGYTNNGDPDFSKQLELVKSNEFVDAVNKSMDKLPRKYFKKFYEPHIKQ